MRTQTHHAIQEIAAERERQISEEGWTAAHDDTHETGEIASFAAAHTLLSTGEPFDAQRAVELVPEDWQLKSKSRRRHLVVAGALIVAELERLERKGE